MRIVLLGSPGSGKGTQATKIVEKFGIPHISTGDIFRKHIRENDFIGKVSKKYIDKGLLVPDEMTLQIVEDRFLEDDCQNGFLLDGFPRNLVQAEALYVQLEECGKKLDAVINLSVTDETIISRMSGRRVCTSCGTPYNLSFYQPTVENICDSCGGKLMIRPDDNVETVINRLKVYNKETQPLIEYYKGKNILISVNGEQDAEVVFNDICSALELSR